MNGGVPHRLTYHPEPDIVVGWSPDGKDILFLSGRAAWNDFSQLFRIHADGSGLPVDFPLPSADSGSLSPDGKQIAYTPFNQWQRAWKRYHGGQTQPVWIVDLATLDLTKVPRDNSNDSNPLWIGDKIYFLSDRNGPVTLFSYDTKSKQVEQVVENKSFDLKSASAGPGGIVYEQFGSIHLYDTAAHAEHPVDITLHGDLPALEPGLTVIDPHTILNAAISPTGARAVFEAHGDIFTVPAEKGDARNLTNTSNAAERDPAWSPDGKSIAYFSDASGEYQLFIRDQNGIAPPKAIDLGPSPSFFYAPHWSPDSKRILYSDKNNQSLVSRCRQSPSREGRYAVLRRLRIRVQARHGRPTASGSPTSKTLHNHMYAVFLYSLDTGKTTQVTDGMSDVGSIAFDRNGKYLYFTASTNVGPSVAGFDLSSLDRAVSSSVYVVVLSKDLPSPLPPESDDEKAKDECQTWQPTRPKKTDDQTAVKDKKDETAAKKRRMKEAARSQSRLRRHRPAHSGAAHPGSQLHRSPGRERRRALHRRRRSGGEPLRRENGPRIHALWRFSLEKREATRFSPASTASRISANGEKMLYKKGDSWFIATADDVKNSQARR